MAQTIVCPNCEHEFMPVKVGTPIINKMPDGAIFVTVDLRAGLESSTITDTFRLDPVEEHLETYIDEQGHRQNRLVQKSINWTQAKINNEINKHLENLKILASEGVTIVQTNRKPNSSIRTHK